VHGLLTTFQDAAVTKPTDAIDAKALELSRDVSVLAPRPSLRTAIATPNIEPRSPRAPSELPGAAREVSPAVGLTRRQHSNERAKVRRMQGLTVCVRSAG
jgi:hypothetical protein